MNNVAMMNAIVRNDYEYLALENHNWDRQTIVMIFKCSQDLMTVRKRINEYKRPSSVYSGYGYEIDGFLNFDYQLSEHDPANRNVRIVYCNMSIMTEEKVNERFGSGYIIYIERKGESNDRHNIGLPEISCKQRVDGKVWTEPTD